MMKRKARSLNPKDGGNDKRSKPFNVEAASEIIVDIIDEEENKNWLTFSFSSTTNSKHLFDHHTKRQLPSDSYRRNPRSYRNEIFSHYTSESVDISGGDI